MQSGEERYNYDPCFRLLVDMIEEQYRRLEYTPSEIRDAAMLAAIHHDLRTVRRPLVFAEEPPYADPQ